MAGLELGASPASPSRVLGLKEMEESVGGLTLDDQHLY